MIFFGWLEATVCLKQDELAQSPCMSPTPLCLALQNLAREELIQPQHHHPAKVAPMTRGDAGSFRHAGCLGVIRAKRCDHPHRRDSPGDGRAMPGHVVDTSGVILAAANWKSK